MAFYTISYKIREHQIKPKQLIPEFFDYVFLEKGDVKNLSEKLNIEEKILIDLQEEFLYWYPVDHRHTAIMHISNHLSFYIFHHVAIFPEKHWPKIITLIEPVIIEGQKMGKSKGNVITLANVKINYSADLFRFYISHGADLSMYFNFREKEMESVRNHFHKFFTFLSDKIIRSKSIVAEYGNIKNKFSKVMLSKIINKFISADKALEEFNIRRYLQISFYEVFNLVQDFFRADDEKDDFLIVLKIIYPEWLKILSPTMPHFCEELWEVAGNEGFNSLELWGNFNKNYISNDLEIEFNYITSVIEDILNIKKIVKIQKSNDIYLYTAPRWKLDVLNLINIDKDNLTSIISKLKKDKEILSNKQLMPYIKNQIKDRIWEKVMPQVDEIDLLRQYKSYIEKRVNASIILNSEFDPKQRSIKAKPYKPGIFLDA